MITLGDLIRKGAVGKEQTFGHYTFEDKVCALGAAYEGLKEAGLVKDEE